MFKVIFMFKVQVPSMIFFQFKFRFKHFIRENSERHCSYNTFSRGIAFLIFLIGMKPY